VADSKQAGLVPAQSARDRLARRAVFLHKRIRAARLEGRNLTYDIAERDALKYATALIDLCSKLEQDPDVDDDLREALKQLRRNP
jgi:hypothetical protein